MSPRAKWGSLVLGSWMLAHVGAAAANDHGLYVDVDGGVASASSSFAWSIIAGYRFNAYFALEAGYTDLGSESLQLEESDDPEERRRLRLGARGATFAMLGHAPVGNWDPYFKVGAINNISDERINARVNGADIEITGRSREPRLFGGIGVRYAFSEYCALGVGIDYFANVGQGYGHTDKNITFPHVGLAYRF